MSKSRTLVSVGFALFTGAALFATGGSAAADVRGDPVLRIVTVTSDDTGCPRHEGTSGRDGDVGDTGQADAGADAL